VQEEISQAISDALSDSLGVRRVQLGLLSGLQLGWLGITTALLGDIDAGRAMLQLARLGLARAGQSRAVLIEAGHAGIKCRRTRRHQPALFRLAA